MTRLTRFFSSRFQPARSSASRSRRQVNEAGWDDYARTWDSTRDRGQIPDLSADRATEVEYLGDEWSLMEDSAFPYGVDIRSVKEFADYIDARLLTAHLPARDDLRIMEIGPGGGRLTKLLLPHARQFYAVDISKAMLQRLQRRFLDQTKIVPIVTDGTHIGGIPTGSLDAAVSFDAFVHMEPWEVFRYLEIIHTLLREGGVGIVHFSDVETAIGFRLFRSQVPSVVKTGIDCATFSVMSKGIMERFLKELGFDIVTITNDVIPRDAVAVFRRNGSAAGVGV